MCFEYSFKVNQQSSRLDVKVFFSCSAENKQIICFSSSTEYTEQAKIQSNMR